jgi:hypothetical protein
MSNRSKWWLSALIVCCLTPAAFADWSRDIGCGAHPREGCQHHLQFQQVPEGGSTAIYLLGAGLTCFAAVFLRSRVAKPTQS